MTKTDKFIEVLQLFNSPITIATWVKKIIELYPAVLIQENGKLDDNMTIKELIARISLKVSKGEFIGVEVEDSNFCRKVYYVSSFMKKEFLKEKAQNDIKPVLLEEKINGDMAFLSESETYRIEEFINIILQLNKYFNLNFKLHYIISLENTKLVGKHHADNFQILLEEHTLLKRDGEQRFSIEEQKAYIKRVIVVYMMVCKNLDISLTDEVLDMLLDRLAKIY